MSIKSGFFVTSLSFLSRGPKIEVQEGVGLQWVNGREMENNAKIQGLPTLWATFAPCGVRNFAFPLQGHFVRALEEKAKKKKRGVHGREVQGKEFRGGWGGRRRSDGGRGRGSRRRVPPIKPTISTTTLKPTHQHTHMDYCCTWIQKMAEMEHGEVLAHMAIQNLCFGVGHVWSNVFLHFAVCVLLFRGCCVRHFGRVPHVWVNLMWVFNNIFSTFLVCSTFLGPSLIPIRCWTPSGPPPPPPEGSPKFRSWFFLPTANFVLSLSLGFFRGFVDTWSKSCPKLAST